VSFKAVLSLPSVYRAVSACAIWVSGGRKVSNGAQRIYLALVARLWNMTVQHDSPLTYPVVSVA
jgi:hypothetical protein